jgi:hypothetical protein
MIETGVAFFVVIFLHFIWKQKSHTSTRKVWAPRPMYWERRCPRCVPTHAPGLTSKPSIGGRFPDLLFSLQWPRVFVLSGMCPLSGMVLHPKGRMIRNSPCTSVNRDSVVSRVKFEIPITLPLPKCS